MSSDQPNYRRPGSPQDIILGLNCLGVNFGYNYDEPEMMSMPIAVGWGKVRGLNTPQVQLSISPPVLLNTNLPSATALKDATGGRYALCSAGVLSLAPELLQKLFIPFKAESIEPEIFAAFAVLIAKDIRPAIHLQSSAVICEIDKEPHWVQGFCQFHIAVAFQTSKESYEKATNLYELMHRAAEAVEKHFEQRELGDFEAAKDALKKFQDAGRKPN